MRLAFLLLVLAVTPARADTVEALLATLHRTQDALALEGESARAVHDRLLKMLDQRIAEPGARHPTGSVVLYALSGGDPRIAARALASVEQTARDAILVRGVLAYVSGRNAKAGRLLALIRPERLRGRLASLVAMAQAGTALRADDRTAAKASWQRVRLEAPGTLLEEAALRRLITQSLETDDRESYFRLLRSYWIRFPRSAFRDRVVRLMRDGVPGFDEATVLKHLPRLATSAARRKGGRLTPHRAQLVKDLVRLAGRDAVDAGARLAAMPLAPLTRDDRRLLLAARAVSASMTAPLAALPPGTAIAGDLTTRHRAALDAADKLLVAR